MKSLRRIAFRMLVVTAVAMAPVACARNDVPPAVQPEYQVSASQSAGEGPPVVALVAIGAALMLLLAVVAVEESGVGLVTPPPPGS
jgi:hypothetical protein